MRPRQQGAEGKALRVIHSNFSLNERLARGGAASPQQSQPASSVLGRKGSRYGSQGQSTRGAEGRGGEETQKYAPEGNRRFGGACM